MVRNKGQGQQGQDKENRNQGDKLTSERLNRGAPQLEDDYIQPAGKSTKTAQSRKGTPGRNDH